MPSFLVNTKMNPALRARILRSLGGRSSQARLTPTAIAVLRVLTLSMLIGALALYVMYQRQQAAELAVAKNRVLSTLREAGEALTPRDRRLVPLARRWLKKTAEPFAGDEFSSALSDTKDLARLLMRATVYVRAPLDAALGEPDMVKLSAESEIDALVACLIDPASGTTEKALLKRLFSSESRAASAEGTAPVERLHPAVIGLPLFTSEWSRRIESADQLSELRQLEPLIAAAPLAAATRAAKADLLLMVLDEPKIGDGPSEFDGTNHHAVRVHLIDLNEEKTLLSVRRTVDPSWISELKRHQRARSLTDCRLAKEIHDAVSARSKEHRAK